MIELCNRNSRVIRVRIVTAHTCNITLGIYVFYTGAHTVLYIYIYILCYYACNETALIRFFFYVSQRLMRIRSIKRCIWDTYTYIILYYIDLRCGLRVPIIAFRYTSVGVSEKKIENNNNNNNNKINVQSTMFIIASRLPW